MKYLRIYTLILFVLNVGISQEIPGIDNFSGEIGLFAAVIDTSAEDFQFTNSVSYHHQTFFPLASSFKPFVLYELLKEIDSGEINFNDYWVIPDSIESLDDPIPVMSGSVYTIASNMISNSVNTYTDMIFKTVGIDQPTQTLANWGLDDLRIILPTREFWLMLSGLVPEYFPYEALPEAAFNFHNSTREEQLFIIDQVWNSGGQFSADQLYDATEDFYLLETWGLDTAFDIFDHIDNLASPFLMANYYYHLFENNDLSPEMNDSLRSILHHGDGQVDLAYIPVSLEYWGGKGGSDMGTGNVNGYAITSSGKHIVYSIMGKKMVNEDPDWAIINNLLVWCFSQLEFVTGDVDGDGFVNVSDILSVVGIILETISPSDLEMLLADVNSDGIIDILDIILIVQIIIGN